MPNPLPSPPSLLRADEALLNRAGRLLLDGSAFLITVSPSGLRSAALAHLQAQLPTLRFPYSIRALDSAQDALDALTREHASLDQVLSIQLGANQRSALEGINWHREKLLQGGPVILWLEIEQMQDMREVAPDAYSFRTSLLRLMGSRPPLSLAIREPSELHRYRRLFQRARNPLERAQVVGPLAQELRLLERTDEAEHLVRQALQSMSTADDIPSLNIRARLEQEFASIQDRNNHLGDNYRWNKRSVETINKLPISADSIDIKLRSLAAIPGPLVRDIECSSEALRIARTFGADSEAMFVALRGVFLFSVMIGNMKRASALLREAEQLEAFLDPYNQSSIQGMMGIIRRASGQITAAVESFELASHKLLASGGYYVVFLPGILSCWLDMGELDYTESLLKDYREHLSKSAHPIVVYEAWSSLWRGQSSTAIKMLTEKIYESIKSERDGSVIYLSEHLASVAAYAAQSSALSSQDRKCVKCAIQDAEQHVLKQRGVDGPPWYEAQFALYLSTVIRLDDNDISEAISVAIQAASQAKDKASDLFHSLVRAVSDALISAKNYREALKYIQNTEPESMRLGFYREAALLQCNRIIAAVSIDDVDSVQSALSGLRASLTTMDSPRSTAEILLELVRRLPPETLRIDVAALAEEAMRLFISFPMPAQGAHAEEIMGDALAAHGRREEARRRYHAARRRLEQHGLLLRAPLIDRKLAALEDGGG